MYLIKTDVPNEVIRNS